jgi:hypothetical protein
MGIVISEANDFIEKKYIGFKPNTGSIKPVHIANGLFRVATGRTNDTSLLNKFVYSSSEKGKIPTGHELDNVFSLLCEEDKIDQIDISMEGIAKLREFMKKVLNSDGAVFEKQMASYSAGHLGFITRDSIGQDGGELIGEWYKRFSPLLYKCLCNSLGTDDDVISLLALPLLSHEYREYNTKFDYDNERFFINNIDSMDKQINKHMKELGEAGNTLARHLEQQTNKLVRLRSIVLFTCFIILRQLVNLESYYNQDLRKGILPFLIDFSDKNNEPVAQASLMNYTLVCQSISRFYAWAFGEYLKEYYQVDELCKIPVPIYKMGSGRNQELTSVWELAIDESINATDPYRILGQAIYDMLALQASANPISYLRQLGNRSGILWPPINTQPTKRFFLQQDTLEVLIRAAVNPGETISLSTLQQRLWDRFGIIIGGQQVDEEILASMGIYQADSNALAENRSRFISKLSNLNFAHLLADGVLKVGVEG